MILRSRWEEVTEMGEDDSWLVIFHGRHTICVPGVVTDGSGKVRLCWANRDTGIFVAFDGEPDRIARLPIEGLPPQPEDPGNVTAQVPVVGSYAEKPHKPRSGDAD